MTFAEIESTITAHKLFRCKLNTHRMWTNAIRAIPILISTEKYLDIDIKDIAHMIIEDQQHVWSAVATLDTWLNSSLNRHDANGRKYAGSETYIAITNDIKLLWARIRDTPEATAYLTDSDTPLYIDIANMRVVQGECSIAGHERIITTAQELGVLCYNAAGEVRALLHNAFIDQNIWTHERIAAMYPRSESIYKMYMSKLYRGGLCLCESQAQEECVLMADITSAHIYQMCSKKYPTTAFEISNAHTLDECQNIINKGYATIIDVEFREIKSRYDIGIETKPISAEDVRLDGTRIKSARRMRVLLTEIDLAIYQKMYTWSSTIVHYCAIAKKNKLPAYVRNTIKLLYTDKANKKKRGEDYIKEKRRVNICYGSMAQKLNMTTLSTDGTVRKQDYNKVIAHKELSPFWAIWTSAYTRLQQIELIHQAIIKGDRLVYGDTDSVYTDGGLRCGTAEAINEINEHIVLQNKKDGLPNELGTWDLNWCRKFRAIGAKQYMYTNRHGETHYTVSGINSEAMQALHPSFEAFAESLQVPNARRYLYKDEQGDIRYKSVTVSIGDAVKAEEYGFFEKRKVKGI